jgi:tetratricopeptide (TPR) repeat protein
MGLAVWTVGCAALKDNSEAIIQVQTSQNPVKAARLTLLGVKAMTHGDVDRATDKFLAAIAADETYGPAHNNLGMLHHEQGNLYQAVLAYEVAMELMPHDPIVLYNLGLTLETAGKVYEAMDLYWQAVEMDPANPNYLGNLVRLRLRLGEDGPDVVAQLQDLVLIETRPDWRRWADRQLALRVNPTLDRGPETPDFNSRDGDRDGEDAQPPDKIIDLTPGDESVLPEPRETEPMSMTKPRLVPSPEFNAPEVRSKPLPVHDTDSFEQLPLSIDRSYP